MNRTLKEVIEDIKAKGAYTIGEAAQKCPELLKEYKAIIKGTIK